MAHVIADISLSLDGYSTGSDQREDAPFGDGTDELLHDWMFSHRDENSDEVDGILAASAFIMGRKMFGPIRGEWEGDWRGWWGENPPYHGPVFVLTHHPREPVEMDGGTTFIFVTDGVDAALARAQEAAGDKVVAIAGGASTINEFIGAGYLDELRLHIVPVIYGLSSRPDIVRVFDGVPAQTLAAPHVRSTPYVTHLTYRLR